MTNWNGCIKEMKKLRMSLLREMDKIEEARRKYKDEAEKNDA